MWHQKTLDEMTSKELFQSIRLRIDTFVVEQNRIYHELDDNDIHAIHVFHTNDKNEVDAYARAFFEDDYISFGRVVTAPSVRGKGMGNPLMEQIMKACHKLDANKDIKIQAQAQVTGYYEKFGFTKKGELFIHEGTPHIWMVHHA